MICSFLLASLFVSAVARGDERDSLNREFQVVVGPFLKSYCAGCHGGERPKAKFDLSRYGSLESVASDLGHWENVLRRLLDEEMPPEDAKKFPDRDLRRRVTDWIERLRRHEATRNAGDPGLVLPRRLSNAEYEYTIHDLTGVESRFDSHDHRFGRDRHRSRRKQIVQKLHRLSHARLATHEEDLAENFKNRSDSG